MGKCIAIILFQFCTHANIFFYAVQKVWTSILVNCNGSKCTGCYITHHLSTFSISPPFTSTLHIQTRARIIYIFAHFVVNRALRSSSQPTAIRIPFFCDLHFFWPIYHSFLGHFANCIADITFMQPEPFSQLANIQLVKRDHALKATVRTLSPGTLQQQNPQLRMKKEITIISNFQSARSGQKMPNEAIFATCLTWPKVTFSTKIAARCLAFWYLIIVFQSARFMST